MVYVILCIDEYCAGQARRIRLLLSGWTVARKSVVLSHLHTKTTILPRQARDKHRKNSEKDRFSSGLTAYRGGPAAAAVHGGDKGIGLWGVPTHRVAGLYAPANAEFTTRAFVMPTAGLYINADAAWPGVPRMRKQSFPAKLLMRTGHLSRQAQDKMMKTSIEKGLLSYVGEADDLYCDERCQGYIMVAVVDPAESSGSGSVVPLPGYEAERCILTNVNGLRIPLRWSSSSSSSSSSSGSSSSSSGSGGGSSGSTEQGAAGSSDSASLAGRVVALRIFYRAATVFSIGALS